MLFLAPSVPMINLGFFSTDLDIPSDPFSSLVTVLTESITTPHDSIHNCLMCVMIQSQPLTPT